MLTSRLFHHYFSFDKCKEANTWRYILGKKEKYEFYNKIGTSYNCKWHLGGREISRNFQLQFHMKVIMLIFFWLLLAIKMSFLHKLYNLCKEKKPIILKALSSELTPMKCFLAVQCNTNNNTHGVNFSSQFRAISHINRKVH